MTPLLLDAVLGALASNSWLLWVVGPLFLLAFAVAYWSERDAQDASRRVAGGVGALGVGVVAVATGLVEGLAAGGSGVIDVLAPHFDFLAQLGLAWAGWSGLQGGLMSNVPAFVVFVVLLIGVSVVWGE